jgi:membrane-associated phospholipid phosphatase
MPICYPPAQLAHHYFESIQDYLTALRTAPSTLLSWVDKLAANASKDTLGSSKDEPTMRPEPFLPEWNSQLLKELFLLFPHSGTLDTIAWFFAFNALASTWIFAAVFYMYWRIEDERTICRRTRLLEIVMAFFVAMLVTLVLRPWVGWPAPTLVPRFQQLYPVIFWNTGNADCFPSHSTLTYLIIAISFWSFKRWLGVILTAWVFLFVSIPRIYIGGHYPIDVVAAVFLAAAGLWAARLICSRPSVARVLKWILSKKLSVEAFLFLWLFELGSGFSSSYWILRDLFRAARHSWH